MTRVNIISEQTVIGVGTMQEKSDYPHRKFLRTPLTVLKCDNCSKIIIFDYTNSDHKEIHGTKLYLAQ